MDVNNRKKLLEMKSRELKRPTTIEEQIEILKSRNVKIENEEYAKNFLKIFNYYFVTGYLHPYKLSNDKYNFPSFNIIKLNLI